MREKVVLVTGATAGIGFFTALGLARLGARVIVTGRHTERGRLAERELRRCAGHDRVHFVGVDHASLIQNRALADRIASTWGRLDVLVNNVGGIQVGAGRSAPTGPDGHELSLTMNFLAPFALTDAVMHLLLASAPARVINVSSDVLSMWKGDLFSDGERDNAYVPMRAYARAKVLNLLWTLDLARELSSAEVAVHAVNPGMAWTPGTERLTPQMVPHWRPAWRVMRWLLRRSPADRAARASIELASDPRYQLISGLYVGRAGEARPPSPFAFDPTYQALAKSLALRLVAGTLRPSSRLARPLHPHVSTLDEQDCPAHLLSPSTRTEWSIETELPGTRSLSAAASPDR